MDILTAFNIDKFNALPDVVESNKRLGAIEDLPTFWSALHALFLNYISMAEIVGVVLLHKHFELGKNEALVDVNDSSTPWRLPIHKQPHSGVFKKYNGLVRPQSWLLDDDKLMPYEFYFDPGRKDTTPVLDPMFVQDFAELLTSFNLARVLGLYLRQSDKTLREVTEGRANVKYLDLAPSDPLRWIQTSWCYNSELLDSGHGPFISLGRCIRSGCYSSSDGDHESGHIEEDSSDEDNDDATVAVNGIVKGQEA